MCRGKGGYRFSEKSENGYRFYRNVYWSLETKRESGFRNVTHFRMKLKIRI